MHGIEKKQIRETSIAAAAAKIASRTPAGKPNQTPARTKNQARAVRRAAERRAMSPADKRQAIATLKALRQIEPSAGRHVRAAYSDSTPDWKIPPIDR